MCLPFTQCCHDRTVTFVDFEYAGYNPRGFDLGNYFCEMAVDNGCDGLPWPGFCMDPGAYPDRGQAATLLPVSRFPRKHF